jgi:sulfite exporter TauE/SafE
MTYLAICSEGFLLGLSTGTYCFVNCIPVLIPFFFSENDLTFKKNRLYITLFILGRLIGYMAVGVIIGFAGYYINSFIDPQFKRAMASIAYIILGSLLILSAFDLKILPQSFFCRKRKQFCRGGFYPLLFGIFTTFNFCPPFLAVASRVMSVGQITSGIIYFLTFFIGTSVYLIPFSGIFLIKKFIPMHRMIAKTCSILLGTYFVLFIGVLNLITN